MVDIVTSNLNGIRAAHRKGIDPWVREHAPQVWCLQEVRAPQEALDPILSLFARLYVENGIISDPSRLDCSNEVCRIHGRAGVALLSTLPVTQTRYGLPGLGEDVDSGRWIERDITTGKGGRLTVVTAYVHSGDTKDPVKMGQKYRFLEHMDARLEELADQARKTGREAVVCGDFNVCHMPLDIRNAKGNVGHSGFLPQERAHMDHWIDDLGFHDVLRDLAGQVDGPYTWWSQRGHAFDNNVGWRIDYQFATEGLARTATGWRIDKAPSYDKRWSDHAPLTIRYDF